MEVELEFEARTYDVDFAGIVSNIVYHRWMEDLRLAVLAQVTPVHELADAGYVPTLVQTLMDFRAPLRLGEKARGRQGITRIGRSSFVFETELRRVPDEKLIAQARHTAVFVDGETGRPVPVPAKLRVLLGKPSFQLHLRGLDDLGRPESSSAPAP